MPERHKTFGTHRSTFQIGILVFESSFSPKIAKKRITNMDEKMYFKNVFTKDAKYSEQRIGLTQECHRWKALGTGVGEQFLYCIEDPKTHRKFFVVV